MIKLVTAVTLTAAAVSSAALLLMHHGASQTVVSEPVATTASASTHLATITGPKPCTVPAPTTAAGYTKMFSEIPAAQWGAADVSISVPLGDGRSVWLYGDTFSAGRFVHSTAITQTNGCLHVSHAGAQLLPNDDAKHIYWIDSARVDQPTLARDDDRDGRPILMHVAARRETLTGTCAWCFKDEGIVRYAWVEVDAEGNLTFQAWELPLEYSQHVVNNPGPMIVFSAHHIGYAVHSHREFKLASGKTLVTTCQNYDDGVMHPMAAYRPIFSEK